MQALLDDLDSRLKPRACELVARAAEAGIPVLLVGIIRTQAQQVVNVATGVSATLKSKHLPQPPENKALALDICPYEVFQLHGPDKLKWDTSDPAWAKLGAIGEALGLRWGGRWARPYDPGHFEYLLDGERYPDIPVTSTAWAKHGIPGGNIA